MYQEYRSGRTFVPTNPNNNALAEPKFGEVLSSS
jgi:hypothetical protein